MSSSLLLPGLTRARDQILDDKALIQKYRNEIDELKKKLAAAEEAERKYKEMERLATEKQLVEQANESLLKKLEEQEELRAKLEEKIRHLTRLILSSTTVRPEVWLQLSSFFFSSAKLYHNVHLLSCRVQKRKSPTH